MTMHTGNLAAADAPVPTGDERRWMEARLAEMGVRPEEAHAGAPAADGQGMIVLSTHPAESAVPPLAPTDGGAPVIASHALHVRAGETLAVRSPDGAPVRVVTGRLVMEPGARVTIHTHAELHVANAVGTGEAPIELIGADGGPGDPGPRGPNGTDNAPSTTNGGTGGPGGPGGAGKPGPGGVVRFAGISGTFVVIAGGGNGGPGGPGGRGGDGAKGAGEELPAGNGGSGGPGGRGGDGGAGGTVLVAVGAMARGSAIQLLSRASSPGAGGTGGDGGAPGARWASPGGKGGPGDAGSPGTELPVFSVRPAD